ncbi:MAG: glutamate--cysteine ligase [Desulfobulbaceae bacterium]|nr:glutamate--cysteine ligase [Desulfobulbaceae bacterium]
MKQSRQNTLELLSRLEFSTALKGIRRGIEKESLRVNDDSRLASTDHPAPFGSPLTHALITTDYAESLMEFITPVGTEAEETLGILADIHRHVYGHLGEEELLWPVSMPCTIEAEDDIELARYGNSNVGKMKTIYRRGLKNRYGSMMQAIAGVHYNFSMPGNFWPVWQQIKGDRQPLQDFISESYLGLIRNFLRLGWLIPYLFGASPAVDSTFLKHARSKLPLKPLGRASHYLPKATSLRMSDLGYNAKEQDNLDISYNSLTEFVCGLRKAASQSNPVFEKIGVKRHGEYRQLNANTLQQEGELYAPIRPKRVTKTGEKLSNALQSRGVEYVEVRSLDVNPYAETGIDLEQMRFLDVFLTFCLLKDSPEFSRQQQRTAQQNLNKVATCGRDLSLELLDGEKTRSLATWGEDIFSDMAMVARSFDKAEQGKNFQAALDCQHQKLTNPALTPSARMLKDMAEQELEVNELSLRLAKKHRHKLLETDYTQMQAGEFAWEAVASRQKQRELEEAETESFDDFLRLTVDNFPPAPSPPRSFRGESCQWPALPGHPNASCELI